MDVVAAEEAAPEGDHADALALGDGEAGAQLGQDLVGALGVGVDLDGAEAGEAVGAPGEELEQGAVQGLGRVVAVALGEAQRLDRRRQHGHEAPPRRRLDGRVARRVRHEPQRVLVEHEPQRDLQDLERPVPRERHRRHLVPPQVPAPHVQEVVERQRDLLQRLRLVVQGCLQRAGLGGVDGPFMFRSLSAP